MFIEYLTIFVGYIVVGVLITAILATYIKWRGGETLGDWVNDGEAILLVLAWPYTALLLTIAVASMIKENCKNKKKDKENIETEKKKENNDG